MKYLTRMEETARHLPQDVLEGGRKMWLAGMGTVGVIGNTTSTLFNTLVEEGKRFQKDEMKRVGDVVSKTTDTVGHYVGETVTFVQDNVQQVTKVALNRLGIPSRRDVSDLTGRVELLTAKVDALAKKGIAHVNN
jgi:poly(hydroxyalkanoate) granule-associated protein